MKYVLTGEQMRLADQYTIEQIGIPSLVLMERAALSVVDAILKRIPDMKRILVVCGSGNNGGDGYAIARLLHLRGYRVELYFAGKEERRSPDNHTQFMISRYYKIPILHTLEKASYDVVIDALFGTGLKRTIEGTYRKTIIAMNQITGYKVAVDLPSGIHDTTGEVMGVAFRADLTVCLAFLKRGLVWYPGREYAGELITTEIGITKHAVRNSGPWTYQLEWDDFQEAFPKRLPDSHKGSYGKALMIVGSEEISGAAYLSAKAAYAVGAGLVQIYTHINNRTMLQQLLPEALITTYVDYEESTLQKLLDWADVVAIGSGIGQNPVAEQITSYTLQYGEKPCVIDADALNLISRHMDWLETTKRPCILTPHMKEMSRLLNCSVTELQARRIELLQSFTKKYPVICVLKDSRTLIADQTDWLCLNQTGNASMAKGGSGDVLTGIITGILAQKDLPLSASVLGVYLHGSAGDAAKEQKGLHSVLASDIIDGISEILKKL